MNPETCLETRPESVAIVACGESARDFVASFIDKTRVGEIADEIWTINRARFAFKHDKCFSMDPPEYWAKNYPYMAERMKKAEAPIITSKAHPDWPMTVDYPLEFVWEKTQSSYFSNSVPYAVAYALAIGVKKLSLFGCDFWFMEAGDTTEIGRSCTEYWLGRCEQAGMHIELATHSTLMGLAYRNAHKHPDPKFHSFSRHHFYGYDEKPTFGWDSDRNPVLLTAERKAQLKAGGKLREGEPPDGG